MRTHPVALLRILACGALLAAASAIAAPPVITQQPGTVVATSGTAATFSVAATATGSLSYQWRHLGYPIANGTGPSLTLNAVTMADAGFYDVVVTADGESTTSQAGRLITAPAQYADQFCLDDSFLPLFEASGASVRAVAADPLTGGFYVGGLFSTIDGTRRWNLARFDANGNIDPSFAPEISGAVLAIAVQADGAIVIGGTFRNVGNIQRERIARILPDGTLDRTFGNNAGFTDPSGTPRVLHLGIQSNGATLAGGVFNHFDGRSCETIIRLTACGARDPGFTIPSSVTPNGGLFVLDRSDRILVPSRANSGTIVRLQADGTLDPSFVAPVGIGIASAIAVQGDGSPIAVLASRKLVRFSPSGMIDPAFQVPLGVPAATSIGTLRVDGNDRVLLGGRINYFNTSATPCAYLIRTTPDGALDSSFNPQPDQSTIAGAIALPDGRVVAGGLFTSWSGIAAGGLTILSADGALTKAASSSFRVSTINTQTAIPVPGGRWLVGGWFTHVNGSPHNGLVQLNEDGSVDTTFNADQTLQSPQFIARQGDGCILVSPGRPGEGVSRLLPDGTLDSTFREDSGKWTTALPTSMVLQPDGKVLLGGRNWSVMRLLDSGSVDPSFGARYLLSSAVALAVQTDGRVIAAGSISPDGSYDETGLFRFLPEGTLDPSFSPPSAPWANSLCLALGSNEQLFLGGYFNTYEAPLINCFAVLDRDGNMAIAGAAEEVRAARVGAVLPQADGKTLINGSFQLRAGLYTQTKRLNADGTNDADFAIVHGGVAVASFFDDQGRLLQVGANAVRAGLSASGMVRFKPGLRPEPRITWIPRPFGAKLGSTAVLEVGAEGEDLRYRWFKNGRELAGCTEARLVIAAVAADDAATYSVEVYNSFGSVTTPGAELLLTEEKYVCYSAWAIANYPELNTDDLDPEHDPEGDGTTNLLHYALNIPPGSGGNNPTHVRTISQDGEDYAAIEFSRKESALDISYHVEASNDLVTWDELSVVPPGAPSLFSVRDNLPLSAVSHRFLRVRVVYLGL